MVMVVPTNTRTDLSDLHTAQDSSLLLWFHLVAVSNFDSMGGDPHAHLCTFCSGWLLPPLAVVVRFGVGRDFFINVILTICGYFPGHAHK